MRARLVSVLLLPLAAALSGCGSLNAELVELVCECEHCDDWREQELLAALDANTNVADAYGCDADFEGLVQCQVNEGTCDDTEAEWSVTKPDKCGTAVTCMMDADCAAIMSTCGVSGMCATMVCDSDMTKACADDSDCKGGGSRCATEEKDYADCIHDASEHDGPGFGG